MIELSIIIISFNTIDLTVGAIKSIFKEGSKINFEILVVDNGSKDDSVYELKKLLKKYKNLKLIIKEKNVGFSVANNIGIKKAKGKYVLLLNSDTVIQKGALEKLIKFAEVTPDAGVIGPRLLNKSGSIQASCYNFPTILTAAKEYWLGIKGSHSKYLVTRSNLVTVDAVVGAAFLITTKAREKVGLLDERYFFYFEDLDYCRRVWSAGLKVYYLPSAKIIHLHGKSGENEAENKDQWRRLIPSSKIYHGVVKNYIIQFILWSGQKWQKL